MTSSSTLHWRECLIEGTCLAIFMVSAAFFATLLQHPSSPLAMWPVGEIGRRILMGSAMGLTAIGIIYSPLGARSGAHMNPAVTLAFLRLGRITRRDAFGYIGSQFVGGVLGIVMATVLLSGMTADPSVNYVATLPGPDGPWVAFVAEAGITFAMMTLVLTVSGSPATHFTGVAAGLFVALCIIIESPLSGMSMNPARTFGSNLLSHSINTLWIYFTAPLLGSLLAAELFARDARSRIRCAKLFHPSHIPCIFGCEGARLSRESV